MSTTIRIHLAAILNISWCIFGAPVTVAATPEPAPATQPTTRPEMTPPIPANTVVNRDIEYAHSAAERKTLDLYSPRGAKAAPVVVFVHGGEWTKGDKSEVSYKPRFLNEHGVIFVAVNYRLSGTNHHPAQVNDVADAVK